MEKVTLPRDVAEAIELVRNRTGWTDDLILRKVYTNGFEADWAVILNARHDVEEAFLIASALVNGYTIEQTPEEKVREYYVIQTEEWTHGIYDEDNFTQDDAPRAVRRTLDILGIKIEGVNA